MSSPLLLFLAFYPASMHADLNISQSCWATLAPSKCFRLTMEISRPVGRMFSFIEIRGTVASPEGAAQLGTSSVNLLVKRSLVPVAGIVEWLTNLCRAGHRDSHPYIFQRDLHVGLLGTFLTVFSNGNRGDIFVNEWFTSSRHCPELEWTSKNGPGNSFKHMAALQTQMRSGYLAACIYFIYKIPF